MGNDSYLVSIRYRPPHNVQQGVKANLSFGSNIDKSSADHMIASLNAMNFGPTGQVDLQYAVVPLDKKAELTITLQLGGMGQALILPPLESAPIVATYHWKKLGDGDCSGQDITCSDGDKPQIEKRCDNDDKLKFTRYMLTTKTKYGRPKICIVSATANNWVVCSQELHTSTCTGPVHPGGTKWVCVKE